MREKSKIFIALVLLRNLSASRFLYNIWLTGGGNGDFVVQEDTVFVSGMNPDLNEEDIAQHFGAIGVIKVIFSAYFWRCYICISLIIYVIWTLMD